MEIDEAICVVPHNPQWFERFGNERDNFQKILKDIVVDVQHIGSTAVLGLVAKPIIDIMLGLRSLAVDTTFINQMETLGYEYLGEAGVSGRQLKYQILKHPSSTHATTNTHGYHAVANTPSLHFME